MKDEEKEKNHTNRLRRRIDAEQTETMVDVDKQKRNGDSDGSKKEKTPIVWVATNRGRIFFFYEEAKKSLVRWTTCLGNRASGTVKEKYF